MTPNQREIDRVARSIVEQAVEPRRREPDYLMLAIANLRADRDAWMEAYRKETGKVEKWRTRTISTFGIGLLAGFALAEIALLIAVIARAQ